MPQSDTDALRPPTAAILIAVCLCVALSWLAWEVAGVRTMAFDGTVRNAVHEIARPPLTRLMVLISRIGEPGVLWVVAVIAAGLFWKVNAKASAVILILAMAGGLVLNESLKLAFHRPRPAAYFNYPLPHSYSFPSGHALFSACFFAALAVVTSPQVDTTWKRVLLWCGAVAAAGVIGLSRIYLGVHYPTDVIGGYLAACLWVVVLAVGNRIRLRRVQRA